MANIASQKKRILRSSRERAENRLLTSTVKTHFRRLESAVDGGDSAAIQAEHRSLVSRIDKAVQKGALHRNTGARKKARAARIAAGRAGGAGRGRRPRGRPPQREGQRQLIAVVGAAPAPDLEVGERDRRLAEVVDAHLAETAYELLCGVGVHREAGLDLLRGDP